MDPVGSVIGSVLLGFGVILLYGAYRNKKVFGADGIIPQALATGSVTNLSEVSEAFEGFGSGAVSGVVPKQAGEVTKLEHALTVIKTGDPSLGDDIENRVNAASSGSTRAELMPLAQLLVLAEAKGFRDSVAVIRNHVQGVTGERI
jgi:hypothetical protein